MCSFLLFSKTPHLVGELKYLEMLLKEEVMRDIGGGKREKKVRIYIIFILSNGC